MKLLKIVLNLIIIKDNSWIGYIIVENANELDINDEGIRIAIAAPPKENEANKELISYLAEVLGVKVKDLFDFPFSFVVFVDC